MSGLETGMFIGLETTGGTAGADDLAWLDLLSLNPELLLLLPPTEAANAAMD